MFDLFLEFYVRAFAVLLPAMAVALAAFYAVHAGLPRAHVVGASLFLGGLLALWYAGASLMAETGLLMPPPTLLDPPYIMMFLLGGAALLWALARLTATGRRISDVIGQGNADRLPDLPHHRLGLHSGLVRGRDPLAVRASRRVGRRLGRDCGLQGHESRQSRRRGC